ncbi:MAG: polyprenyl synthetase family protein [Treponema sp.]|jgi:octaprenyl-diphosphate synthase|nr:polyprenyl synthetase family protein [Treponema sp.]
MEQYTRRIAKIEAILDHWLPEAPDPAWAEQVFPGLSGHIPPDLLKALCSPGRDLLDRGGKRWRPLLQTLVCESLGGGEAALPLTPLTEFCHNASLIHDDIEDSSDERRGKPAVHLLHGIDASINSGSFLYFLPLACIEEWEKNLSAKRSGEEAAAIEKNRIFSLWGEHIRRLHLGQAMDIAWHRVFESLPSLDDYYTMCGLKTGCLARMAALLGAAAAEAVQPRQNGAARIDTRLLGKAAEDLGVGFQILDDVKNLTEGIPGKKRGDDVVEGKKSLPVLLYLHRRPDKRDFAGRCFAAAREGGAAVPQIMELISAMEREGVLEEGQRKGLSLIEGSKKLFEKAFAEYALSGVKYQDDPLRLLLGLPDLLS